jgi:hypothetical protein
MISRKYFGLIAAGILVFFVVTATRADAPDFSGHWQVDPTKSHFDSEKTLSLDIQWQGEQITFVRTYQANGKQTTARFTCTANGKECAFNDNGHKAKISIWYNGPVLVVLKTHGEKHDSTVEWQLKLGHAVTP